MLRSLITFGFGAVWSLGLAAGPALGAFHLWDINEIYSNADGSVQFIELFASSNSQQFLRNHGITARSADGAQIREFTFPANSGSPTRNRHLLIATEGFADVPGGVRPDFVLPANFLFFPAGSVNFAGVDTLTYTSLPTDGVTSLTPRGAEPNSPTTFAGVVGSIQPEPAPDPPAVAGSDMIISPLGETCPFDVFTFDATEPLTVDAAQAILANAAAPSVAISHVAGGTHEVRLSSAAPPGEWVRIDMIVVGQNSNLGAVLTVFAIHLPLDVDGGGTTTIGDATAFGNEFDGGARRERIDLNCDGRIDVQDATTFGDHWFGRPPATRAWRNVQPADKPDAVAPIDAALTGTCVGGRAPTPNVPAGPDLHKVTLDHPEAICNDGTPAVIYIQRADDVENADRWVFFFQGGSGCTDFISCRQRWCGQHPTYTAAKMSSQWTHDAIRGSGVLNRERTPLAAANLVYLYYCSSDSWTGQNSAAILTHPDDPSARYSLAFRGHSIVGQVFELLDGGPVSSDDGEETVPSLLDAADVLITGLSAGAVGARHNTDWITSRFDPAQTRVRAAYNAGIRPLLEFIPDAPAPGDPSVIDQINEATAAREAVFGPTGYNAFLDESCRAILGGTVDEPLCTNTTYVTFNHITTPFFVQADLRDSVSAGNFEVFGVTRAEFGQAMRETMLLLPDIPTSAIEADAIEVTPGVYGPNCGRHVWFTNNGWYFDATVDGPNGTPRSFDDALRAWLQGTNVFILDTQPPTRSVCGPNDPDIDP